MYIFSVLNVPGAASWACKTRILKMLRNICWASKKWHFRSCLSMISIFVVFWIYIYRETTNDLLIAYVFYYWSALLKWPVELIVHHFKLFWKRKSSIVWWWYYMLWSIFSHINVVFKAQKCSIISAVCVLMCSHAWEMYVVVKELQKVSWFVWVWTWIKKLKSK